MINQDNSYSSTNEEIVSSRLGPEQGFITTCSYDVGAGLCGRASHSHLAVPEDGSGFVGDADLGYMVIDVNSIFACVEHVEKAVKLFPAHAIHKVNPACGKRGSIWIDPGCAFPPDGLLETQARERDEVLA